MNNRNRFLSLPRLLSALLLSAAVQGAYAQEAAPGVNAPPPAGPVGVQPELPQSADALADGESIPGDPLEAGEIAEPPEPPIEYKYKFSLEKLGAQYPMNLRGVDGSDDVPFSIRADELVTAARLDLTYAYSPALLSDLSHINVLVNDEVAYSIPVPRDTAGRSLMRDVTLPPWLITEFNRLRLQLIGHYTLDCEDPLHSSLWANISNQSQLWLAVQHLDLPLDLAALPQPFFDPRDVRRLELPFVFANGRDAAVLQSAGVVATWFGALADYRGARFPAQFDHRYPDKGNAVVFLKGPEPSLPGLEALSGPTLALANNPNDPQGRLLIVAGRDDDEIMRAARALVTGSKSLTGQQAVITEVEQRQARKPYDAPRWVPSDRPVKFGELVDADALDVAGYDNAPIRIPLRVAPDLFGWREDPAPVHLRYRYTPQTGEVNSSVLISARDQFLRSYPLLSVNQLPEKMLGPDFQDGDLLPVEARFTVPVQRLIARSELSFKFMYDYIKEGQCRDIIIDNMRGRIDPESTLDLSQYPHFMPMPNLTAFSDSGFPFTRMADLSETTVVLADDPTEADVTTFLVVMGRFGESTGYPGTGLSVAFGQTGLQQADRDILVVASGQQPWLAGWAKYMPAVTALQSKRFDTSDRVFKTLPWLTPDPRESQTPTQANLAYTSEGANVVFAGFESPVTSGRSVVLVAGSTPQAQDYAVDALLNASDYDQPLQGSLSAVDAEKISPLVDEYTYTVGSLGWWRGLEWRIAKYWPAVPAFNRIWTWVGVVALIVLLLALWRQIQAHRLLRERKRALRARRHHT